MTKESRIIVRLIATWIIFGASLVLTFWAIQNLTMSVVKLANGGYQVSVTMDKGGMGPGYGYTSYTSCLMSPMYPSPMGIGAPEADIEPAAMAKYNSEMAKYNSDYAAACRADVDRQQKTQSLQEKSASSSDITVYSIMLLLGIFAAILSIMVIRKSEEM